MKTDEKTYAQLEKIPALQPIQQVLNTIKEERSIQIEASKSARIKK